MYELTYNQALLVRTGGNIKTLIVNSFNKFHGYASESPGSVAPLRHRIFALFFLVIIASIICWLNFSLHFNGFALNDYHEYCQIARNFYEGHGYSTSVLRPIAYQFFQTLPQPEVTRMPLYPYVLSLFFHLFGPNDNTVVLANSLCYVTLVILIFLITVELSHSIFVGLMAALMTIGMESFLAYTVTAEPNILYAALFLAFIYFFLLYPDRFFFHGMFLGILYIARANSLFVFAGFLVALFLEKNSWKQKITVSLWLIAGFTAGLIPYMIRNFMVVGKPLFSLYTYSLLLFTSGFPSYTIWTQISTANPTLYALSHPGEMLSKSLNFFFSLINGIIPFYKPEVLLLVLPGFFLPVNNARVKLLKLAVIAGIVIQTVLVMPVGPVPYYYMFFFPLMVCIAAINARDLIPKYAPAILFAAFAIFIYTTIPYWKTPKQANPFISIGQQIAETTDKTDIILTDIAWEVAWYADRRTVWLTYDLDTLNRIRKTLKPKYLLLTGRSYADYKDNLWMRMIQDRSYARDSGFEFIKPLRIGNQIVAVLFKAVD